MAENYGFQDIATTTADNLIGGDHPTVSIPVTLLAGARTLTRGTILGKITASGKYTAYTAGAADGSQAPAAILAVTKTIGASDEPASAYVHGVFNTTALTGYVAGNFVGTPVFLV